MKTVTIFIDEDGESIIDLAGFHGQGCNKVFSDFATGDDVKIEHTKHEYYERVSEKERQGQ